MVLLYVQYLVKSTYALTSYYRNSTAEKQPRKVWPNTTRGISWETKYGSSFPVAVGEPQNTLAILVLASNADKWVIGQGL